MSRRTLKVIATVAFCAAVIWIRPLALIVGGAMLFFAVIVAIWAHWKALKDVVKGKTPDAVSPDQDIFHHP